MKNNQYYVSLEQTEMTNIYGGIDPVTIGVIGIIASYCMWAADFCYTLGKD